MKFLLTGFLFSFLFTSIFAIEPNQWDNFQDGTTQGWGSGPVNPNPPINVSTGGPGGSSDAYLRVISNDTVGAGSMLITFNVTQWTGNYVTAGVTAISMYMNNFSNETLFMRIAMQGPGGNFWSVNPVTLLPQSGWQIVQFSLQPASLTGGVDVNATLSGVSQFRILHNAVGAYIGATVDAEIGIDNITAAENPLPVELVSFTANQNGSTVGLSWVTASEINNLGFEIERKLFQNGKESDWRLLGFKEGYGTSSEQKTYFFNDDLSGVYAEKAAYRLKQIDFDGTFTYSDIVYIENIIPMIFSLEQNFPNPFNPATKIKFKLPQDNFVSLKVYNSLGKEVAVLVNERKEAGNYQVDLDASTFASGIYYYKLNAGDPSAGTGQSFSETKKMILLK